MSAKSDLFERLKHLGSAVSLKELIDIGIAQDEHNGRANLLRKGVGIIGFNLLEDYVKNRTNESLTAVSGSGISFVNLPDKLRYAATLKALNALHTKAKMEEKAGRDWLSLVQVESQKIHSTSNHVYELSSFSLASSGSNVSPSDVSDILAAFGIQGGWTTLKGISDCIGGGIPDLSQAYQNLMERRHSAAHSAGFSFSHAWLASMSNEILAIAAAFDIAMTAKLRMAATTLTAPLQQHDISLAMKYIFLEEASGIYRETRVLGGKSRKNWPLLKSAVVAHKPKLAQSNSFLIVLGADRRICDWHI